MWLELFGYVTIWCSAAEMWYHGAALVSKSISKKNDLSVWKWRQSLTRHYKSWGTPEQKSLQASSENRHGGCGRDVLRQTVPGASVTTGKARSPTVDSHVRQTVSDDDEVVANLCDFFPGFYWLGYISSLSVHIVVLTSVIPKKQNGKQNASIILMNP